MSEVPGISKLKFQNIQVQLLNDHCKHIYPFTILITSNLTKYIRNVLSIQLLKPVYKLSALKHFEKDVGYGPAYHNVNMQWLYYVGV